MTERSEFDAPYSEGVRYGIHERCGGSSDFSCLTASQAAAAEWGKRVIVKQTNPLDNKPLRLLRIAGFSFDLIISVYDTAATVLPCSSLCPNNKNIEEGEQQQQQQN